MYKKRMSCNITLIVKFKSGKHMDWFVKAQNYTPRVIYNFLSLQVTYHSALFDRKKKDRKI